MVMKRPLWLSKKSAIGNDVFKELFGRSVFHRDLGAIVHASQSRRSAHKTQVYSVPDLDYPRTRLSHSLEASQIGRQVARFLGETLRMPDLLVRDFEDLTTAACLAHDLGHPPFGHVGAKLLEELTKTKNDYVFDDNRQVVRLLLGSTVREDFGVTAALVDAVLKKKWDEKLRAYPSERETVRYISEEITHTNNWRHPACFLMEIADDTSFMTADLEDAVWLELIDESELEKILKKLPFIDKSYQQDGNVWNYVKTRQDFLLRPSIWTSCIIRLCILNGLNGLRKVVSKRRSMNLNDFPKLLSDFIFVNGHPEQKFNFLFWADDKGIGKKLNNFKSETQERIFKSKLVSRQTIVAEKVIKHLWNALHPLSKHKSVNEEIFHILPKYVQKKFINYWETPSKETPEQIIADYISGMSDRYAIKFLNQISDPDTLELRVA